MEDTTYTYDDQVKDVVKGLCDLRKENALCDAVLETTDGETFPVHRNVLSAASTYFKAMFCGGFKESECKTETPIVLHNIRSIGLKAVLDFVYSGVLSLNCNSVYEVLAAAHMFELHVILHTCTGFLIEKMSASTCFKSLQVAQSYLLQDVATAAEIYIVNNLVDMSNNVEFNEIRKEELCRYLRNDGLKGDEIEIYRVAKHWLDHDSSRMVYLTEVMSNINFKAIPAKVLASEVMQVDSFKYNKECFEMALSAIVYHAHPFSQPLSGGFSQFRGEEKVIIIEDGELESKDGYTTTTPNKMSFYTKSDVKFALELDVTDTLKCQEETMDIMLIETSINIVTVGNFMYIFGTDSATYSSVAKRFDGSTRSWINLAPIPRNPGVASAASTVGDFIIIVGGMVVNKGSRRIRDASQFVNSALQYSVRQNQWTRGKCFPSRIAYTSSCSYDDLLYVTGGNVPKQNILQDENDSAFYTSRKLHAYDQGRNIWLVKPDMKMARSEAVFEAVNGKLFVLGGCKYEDDAPVRSIEMYDILENQWSLVEQEPGFPYDSAASYVDGENIIILGGYNYEDDSASSNVTVFSPNHRGPTCIKHLLAQLKNITCQHACAVLKMNL